jgi:hypothetical protein
LRTELIGEGDMSAHPSVTYHALEYTRKMRNSEAEAQLVKGLVTPIDRLRSLRGDRIPDIEIRKLAENFCGLFGKEEFYFLGKDFIEFFYNNRQVVDEIYPFGSIISRIRQGPKLTEHDIKVLLGYFSQINTSLHIKLLAFKEDYLDFSIKKMMDVYKTEEFVFKSDADFIFAVCQQHRGGFEQALVLMGAEDAKIEEIFHQGDRDSLGNEYPHCLYRLFLSRKAHESIFDRALDPKEARFRATMAEHKLSIDDLKTLRLVIDGDTYESIEVKLPISKGGVAARIGKLRKAFGARDKDELVAIFKKDTALLDLLKKTITAKPFRRR